MNKISDHKLKNKLNDEKLYNKRKQFASLFDDKKQFEENYRNKSLNNKNNIITKNEFLNYQTNHAINGQSSNQTLQHYTPFNNYGKVYTTIFPISSQAYGSYFKNNDINKNEQSPNKIYY